MDLPADLVNVVHKLKVDRDTWHAVALQYKAALQAQTARLQELRDICYATQAELENERAQHRRLHPKTDRASQDDSLASHSDDEPFGTTIVASPSCVDVNWRSQSSVDSSNPVFERVQQFASQRNYGTALVEIERLLRGPLSYKARCEGLLLKSNMLRTTDPDSLYDALASCSEALELCDRIPELQSLLPKIQYQRGMCYYQLHMLQQAREAFKIASEDSSLFESANEYRQSCDDELEMLRFDRRPAFDESRSANPDLLAHLEVGLLGGRLRRTSAQLRMRATQKAKRMSLPHRWVSSTTDPATKSDQAWFSV